MWEFFIFYFYKKQEVKKSDSRGNFRSLCNQQLPQDKQRDLNPIYD